MESQAPTPYEVHCSRCGVSFPVGTKKCIHCGERIGRPRAVRVAGVGGRPRVGAPPPPVFDDVDDEEVPGRAGLMSPVAILWIVLILGSAAYRACS